MPTEIKRRPGGRSERVRTAVLDAADTLAGTTSTISVAALASRSGVSEVTIYRRWGSADNVLLEAAVRDLQQRLPIKITGDVRADLTRWAERARRSIATPRGQRLLVALAQARLTPGAPANDTSPILESRRSEIQRVLDNADPPSSLTAEDVLDRVLAPLYLRLLFGYDATATASELVDQLLE